MQGNGSSAGVVHTIALDKANAIVDRVLEFVALEAGVSVPTTQCVLRQVFRFFFYSWINQGCPVRVIRSSKRFWYNVEGYEPRRELIQFFKYLRVLLKLIAGLILCRKVFCVGARDKRWVEENYGPKASRIDFAGSPDWIVHRSPRLRVKLAEFIMAGLLAPEAAHAVATTLPEDLLEGTLFRLRLFLKMIRSDSSKQVCSEDLIENSSSACLVVVAIERQWEFIYKEHAVPMFIFRDHWSWDYLKVASNVILSEDYREHICEEELLRKSLYSPKNRKCRFTHDPDGKVLVCLPFIFGISWAGTEAWSKDTLFYESDLRGICRIIDSLARRENLLVRHHPLRSRGVSLENFPLETYDGSLVKEVIFIGWTQGLFECLGAGVPARILLMRPLKSLTATGERYFNCLKSRGLLSFELFDTVNFTF